MGDVVLSNRNAESAPPWAEKEVQSKPLLAADSVFETLRERILTFDLSPGYHLTESHFCEEFGVSATPVREALQRLVQVGLADREAAKGVRVHRITADEIRDIFEFRKLLEPVAFRDSSRKMDEDAWLKVEVILQKAKEALDLGNIVGLAKLNSQFHWGLVEHCRNHILLGTLQSLRDRHRLMSLHGWSLENHSRAEWEEHCEILHFARTGDIEAAAGRLASHIGRFMASAISASQQGNNV